MLTKLLDAENEKKSLQLDAAVTPDRSFFPAIPNMSFSKVQELNRLFREIEAQYKNEIVYLILIHKRDCYFCQKSIPFWNTITEELSRRLPNFRDDALEYSQYKMLKNGQVTSGQDVLHKIKVRGTPAVLSNGKGSHGKFKAFPAMRVIWDVMIAPLPLLREVFGVQ